MKKYRPIRIFSIRFGYGWWWGKYFFFIGKHSTAFAIMPMSFHHRQCEYMNGNAVEVNMARVLCEALCKKLNQKKQAV